MTHRDPAQYGTPEPEPAPPDAPPDAPPASRARRPGEMRTAVPAVCLFCVNLLLGVILLGSSLQPSLFGVPQPQRITPGTPGASPTVVATFTAGAQPAVASPAQTTAQSTPSVIDTSATPPVIHTSATATPTAQPPTPTAQPTAPAPAQTPTVQSVD
jgi:hypothetical protein